MISKPLYIYLQRPDNGVWVTVGRYVFNSATESGGFRYSPNYLKAGLPWSIDPVNLPLLEEIDFPCHRYGGLHDVLRDASPDAWGRLLLKREHGLPDNTHAARFLALAGNAERWGALAVGTSKTPPASQLTSPRPASLEALTAELLAVAEHRPAIDARLRRRLMATTSLGGARPKATVRDGDTFWLVKPRLATDTQDIPAMEHMAERLAASVGLHTATTELHRLTDGWSVLRVLRFDRSGEQRHMAISGASLLQTEYPGGTDTSTWSYPRLAEELKRIGAPDEDRHELFRRMVFNAVIGNDDDHPKNHAAIYRHDEQRWRLAPAFDAVPNPDETPVYLAMQLSQGTRTIARPAALADFVRFGFSTREQAAQQLDLLLRRLEVHVTDAGALLTAPLREMIGGRITANIRLLAAS